MNGKAAKLCRKIAEETGKPVKRIKRDWYSYPHAVRGVISTTFNRLK